MTNNNFADIVLITAKKKLEKEVKRYLTLISKKEKELCDIVEKKQELYNKIEQLEKTLEKGSFSEVRK